MDKTTTDEIRVNEKRIEELERRMKEKSDPFKSEGNTTDVIDKIMEEKKPALDPEDAGITKMYFKNSTNEKYRMWTINHSIFWKGLVSIVIIWKFGNTINNVIGWFGGFL
jgi:hypothetical protein